MREIQAELSVSPLENQNSQSVHHVLSPIDGILKVDVNRQKEQVTVRYDDSLIRLVDIKQALMEKGFAVIEV